MSRVSLPHDAKAGPTKPEVRAVLASKLALTGSDHFAEVGSCTGAVTITAARRAGRVTALERKPNRLDVTRKNLAANDIDADVELREAEAPEGLPDDADALFLGGSRNYEAVLDHAVETGVDRIVMNVSRLEVAGAATEAFRDRDILEEVVQFQVSHGYELAGATSFNSENPVYMLVGSASEDVAADGAGGPSDADAASGGKR
ncbi:precorrin-6Y C5,15-methyltransferase (decarboxylating) subunit CbiT [Haloarcula sp. CBA1130]|uniref:precorrin-6Y C5,15-methyltransferase (decarboxylating) subunit CbiT n=1 Tax=unclassified Haloarcula TaxID=2624677 RepID=UPI0012474EBB|nr:MULTISPECIES: precorrin-6Y C5,15-methyltransferase (decarboxylating) subunit CbiT [unclassified Haloarcula]KAA9399196.1 precorrin-6Y C5,15-methyltransferase (decarboxylating) subunit CbiT [Haloarcula sp. CBA1129]KAA9403709.1 precorrin-6Y C5,15-methyltransferase (decarboxylating) subunit CbiT [Haloarcula sp. CBA1130]